MHRKLPKFESLLLGFPTTCHLPTFAIWNTRSTKTRTFKSEWSVGNQFWLNPFELILKYFTLDRMLSIFKTFVIIFSYGNIGFKLWDLNRYYLNSFADLANLIFSLFTNSRRGNRTNSPGLVSLLTFKCNWFIVQLVPSIKKAHGSGGEESIFDS